MNTQTTKTFQHVSEEKLATLSRSRWNWNWNRIRTIAFWTATFVVVFELTAGSMWSLLQIEWVRPVESPGIPGLLRLHFRRVAGRGGRRDHRAQAPPAQGMGVRGGLFPVVGCRGDAPSKGRLHAR